MFNLGSLGLLGGIMEHFLQGKSWGQSMEDGVKGGLAGVEMAAGVMSGDPQMLMAGIQQDVSVAEGSSSSSTGGFSLSGGGSDGGGMSDLMEAFGSSQKGLALNGANDFEIAKKPSVSIA